MEKLFGPDDPVFPKTKLTHDENSGFKPDGLTREVWASTAPICQIFREAFTRAGLPYFNPHSFRKTITNLGEKICQNPEQFKVWSQNLGHESPLTTFTSYGHVSPDRQAQVMHELAQPRQAPTAPQSKQDWVAIVREAMTQT